MKGEDCPQFQESFNFRLEEEDLQQSGLKFTCMQSQSILERGQSRLLIKRVSKANCDSKRLLI